MFTADMIKIMQHYVDGGDIEFKLRVDNRNKWKITSNPTWDWYAYTYRIKEEKQKITIERWLLYDKGANVYFECRASNMDIMLQWDSHNTEKVKLLDSYDIEL